MGSAPSVPVYNPQQVSQQQQTSNEQTAIAQQLMSQVGQQTPYGSLSYNQTGSYTDPTTGQVIPLTTATTQLSPIEQELLNLGQGTQLSAAGGAGEMLHNANYGGSNPIADVGGMTSALLNPTIGQFQQYEQPFFNQQTEALTSQLANQGLTPSDPAYKTAMNNLMQSQGQTTSGFLSQMEPQAFGQAENLYNLPLQTAESLYSVGAPASLSTNLINTPTASVSPTNVTGAYASAQQAQTANAQLQEQQYSGMLTGLGSLGAALLG